MHPAGTGEKCETIFSAIASRERFTQPWGEKLRDLKLKRAAIGIREETFFFFSNKPTYHQRYVLLVRN